MRKWAGDAVYELMWQPLMIGKFGERYAEQVNMAWMWARLKARTTRLGTFQGGFQAFADALAGRLRQMGVDIRLSTPVEKIETHAGGRHPPGNHRRMAAIRPVPGDHLARLAGSPGPGASRQITCKGCWS